MNGCLLSLIAGLCLAAPENLELYAEGFWKLNDRPFFRVNGRPYEGSHGDIGARMVVPITPSWSAYYHVGHRSYLETTRDSGYEYGGIGIVWRPLAHR